ncbi:cob(I)yrinic acid a,c-diamide adenosyltransferase [Bacteroidales bacterium OttesenSCG-928-C19]|nr:cob(I)yrinic acid a,c-diamide adenosyltransferase [Bacteroidales bacterium OttesenSCG-928-C19]
MIYTKKGDSGETSLVCGKRVSKGSLRVECYGSVDELNSYLGLLRSHITEKIYQEELIDIQKDLFVIQTLLATEDLSIAEKLPPLQNERILFLEKSIDSISSKLPIVKSFTLPGGTGSVVSSHAHVARCICRRVERLIVNFAEQNSVQKEIQIYLNRLSDYLYVLSNILLVIDNKENILIKF